MNVLRKPLFPRLAVLLSFASFASLVACADDTPDPLADQSDVDAIVAAGAVGAQVEVTDGADHLWLGAGVSDRDGARAVAEGDRFRIASTTKPFVMAVALMLVEDGAITLDDTVERWLPGRVARNGNDGGAITIRHLLGHTSGLANHVDDQIAALEAAEGPDEVAALLTRTWTPEELCDLATSHPPRFAPGAGFAYSDTNYVLLGMIVQAATGQSWAAEVEARLAGPLGLEDTYFPGEALAIEGAHMRGYASFPGAPAPEDVTSINPTSIDAAGALVSTPRDVGVFLRALVKGELFGPVLVDEMKTMLPADPERPDVRYGLGLGWAPRSCGGGYFMHDGDTLGYHTRTGVSEDGARSVVVAISGDGALDAPSHALIDRVLCAAR